MRETQTEEPHRYNSETKPIHAQDWQLLRYGSWVWIIGMDHVLWRMDHGYGSWGMDRHVVPGYGSEPYSLSCSHIYNFLTWRFLTLLNCLRTRVIVLTAGFVQVRLHPCPQNSEKGPSLILQE